MNMVTKRLGLACALAMVFGFVGSAMAATLTVEVYEATNEGRGVKYGAVTVSESKYGLVFTPELKGLPAGAHGFHIHANPDCGPATAADGKITPAGKAGGHYDPTGAGKHNFPWEDDGHLGDLPALYVNANGEATIPVLAPKLKKLDDVRGRSLMIHVGGDNYSDKPAALGGGGARLACGVIN